MSDTAGVVSNVSRAANSRQPPAAPVHPVLIPSHVGSLPSRTSRLCSTTPSGKRACCTATRSASVGLAITALARRTRSLAVETVFVLMPLGSAKWVLCIPIAAAVAFILAMNAVRFPSAHTASDSAMLSAEGSSNASMRSRSVRTSPACTGRLDPPSATACRYSATSALVMVREGPLAPGASGSAWSTTSAVIAFATDPIGRTTLGAWLALSPGMVADRAKLPRDGTGIGPGGWLPASAAAAGTSICTVADGQRCSDLHHEEGAPRRSASRQPPR